MLKSQSPAALVSAALFVSALALHAADVWVAKPYTAWSDKDIRKIMTDSPWSRSVSVILLAIPDGGFLRRRPPAPDGPGIAETGGGLGVGGPQGGPSPPPVQGGPPKTKLIVRWQSATVVQQALVKAQYGDQAGSSPEARKRLTSEAADYIIAVGNLPSSQERKALLGMTTLTVSGKDHPIAAKDVVYVEAGGGTIEARFLFPRDFVLTADDKEVEFATLFGKMAVKAKFNLKNMAINGKLGL